MQSIKTAVKQFILKKKKTLQRKTNICVCAECVFSKANSDCDERDCWTPHNIIKINELNNVLINILNMHKSKRLNLMVFNGKMPHAAHAVSLCLASPFLVNSSFSFDFFFFLFIQCSSSIVSQSISIKKIYKSVESIPHRNTVCRVYEEQRKAKHVGRRKICSVVSLLTFSLIFLIFRKDKKKYSH